MNSPIPLAVSARAVALRLPVNGALYHLPQPLNWRLAVSNQPERQGKAESVVLLLDDLEPATSYRLRVEGLDEIEFRTPVCAGLIRPEGMIEGAPHDDLATARHNAAILADAVATVSVGGTVYLPKGDWVTMPVALKSDMTLYLAEGAFLRAPSLRDGWPILPARDGQGQMLGSWEGLPANCFAAPLHAIGADRLVIAGRGCVDGSGDKGDWWTWPKETRDGARRPRGLHLIGCSDVTLLGFTIRNAPSWTIHPQGCDRIKAVGLNIQAPADSPNTDGFNPEMCWDVTIEGVRFSVGDDCIAVKAGKRGPEGQDDHLAETRNIRVRHCLMERGHGGLVIGSEMSGGVYDVAVEDCEMLGTDRGLRIKTRRGRGGVVSDIAMRRVTMKGVQTALSVNAHYHCDPDGHAAWVQDRAPAPVDDRTPHIRGITVEDVTLDGLAHAAGCFLGLPEAPIEDVRIRRLNIGSLDADAVPTPPDMADRVRPMLHEPLLAEQAMLDCDDAKLVSLAPITLA
ncbi:glycoside hydrolase family 28 protein [Paracoccus aestuariivivens]|uniref:Glycoside hydrolase family 28 protein n=1 Tax=Paracoccus aestuariivivens TaxID=1820333 RepID=A0A6L6JB08_9RHOB|nr:glycoside hydrolase family 28 protein [Paracoccus aestuariivivens]MTH77334.1 glycoside hydrolase family 28 protein [Paracoccus aestuariivivens]